MSNQQLLDKLAEKEYEQWCYWSKGLIDDYTKLISLLPLEELSGSDHDFVVSQLDRLDRWEQLWESNYEDIKDELKKDDYKFAKISLELQEKEINNLKKASWEAEEDYINERFHDNPIRKEQWLKDLEEDFKRGYWND